MSKIVSVKDIGIPVPATPPPATDSIACYWGSKGFTPSYSQASRAQLALSALSIATVNSIKYYDFPVGTVLPVTVSGDTDFYFTLVDSAGSESDFNPVITQTVDRTAPPTLGQSIVLG